MNEIVRNCQSFIEILQNSRQKDVKCWDIAALQRALNWAKYFEEVYIKLKEKPNTIKQIDMKLKLICSLPGAVIGDNTMTLKDLGQSQRLLLKSLIYNPNLPSHLFGDVLEKYTQLAEHNSDTGSEQFIQDASECIQAKSSRICLQQTLLKTLQDKYPEDHDVAIPEFKEEHAGILNARLLRRFLVHHHSNSPCPQKTSVFLDQILHDAASQPNGMRIIAMTISLPTENDDIEKKQVDACEQFIFDWIQNNKRTYVDDLKEN